jgi:hypothetical protein
MSGSSQNAYWILPTKIKIKENNLDENNTIQNYDVEFLEFL